MTRRTLSARRRIFGTAQLVLAAMLALGSAGEVLNLLFPSLLPSIQDVPLMRLHHTERFLFYWTVLSNTLALLLALTLLRAALGVFKDDPEASRLSRRAIVPLALLVTSGLAVVAHYLIPGAAAGRDAETLVILFTTLAPAPALLGALGGLYIGHGTLLRKRSAASAVPRLSSGAGETERTRTS